jgi:hypothetical protein
MSGQINVCCSLSLLLTLAKNHLPQKLSMEIACASLKHVYYCNLYPNITSMPHLMTMPVYPLHGIFTHQDNFGNS